MQDLQTSQTKEKVWRSPGKKVAVKGRKQICQELCSQVARYMCNCRKCYSIVFSGIALKYIAILAALARHICSRLLANAATPAAFALQHH